MGEGMTPNLTEGEIESRRSVAATVFATEPGRAFVSYLLDDLGVWDIAIEQDEMVLRNFGIVLLRRYFEVTDDFGTPRENMAHRSLLTEAIIGVSIPQREIEDE